MHTTALSDTHVLPSHPLPPIRTPALYPAVPNPLPTTVTFVPPVVGPFVRLMLLATGTS